jgi:hypothetical protein
METDVAYFRRRASEEHVAATAAGHPQARRAHVDMAKRYENLARAIEVKEDQLDTGMGSGETRDADADRQASERASMWL